jgi:thiamine biosynthesis protein ThiI
MHDKASSSARDVIWLRVAEIFLKGRNRRRFFSAFVRHARRLLADLPEGEVEALHLSAQVLHPPELRARCLERLSRLCGLASMSVARQVDPSVEAIAAAAIERARALPPGTTFKIETRRQDKRFPMTSQEVSREIGARVVGATGLGVDLHHPACTISIVIGAGTARLFSETIDGPGGLPVGTSGQVSLLLSGGIDSPVAGWSAMRRGCQLHAVYFHSFPYTGDKSKEKVLDLARLLAPWQGELAVHVVGFTDVQKALREAGPADLAVLLYRRMMMRAGSLLAVREGSSALVTGESLGQVASQTLANLAVIEDAATLPVLRPLLTYDKLDIVRTAQRIGTYETSILPYDDCCTLFVPKHPATRGRLHDVEAAESALDVAALARALADAAERFVVDTSTPPSS